ncbi:MAG: ATP-binding protein, partial [Nodosilinea sp.]
VAPVTLAITTNHLTDSRSQSTAILWSLRDITARCQMGQALQAAYNDLEHQVTVRTAELVQINDQLQQEIEERRQAEHTIRYQAHLIDVATDAIYVLDPNQLITFWNQGAEKVYGWTAAEALGKNVEALLGESDALTNPQTTVGSGGWRGEANHQRKDGQRVTVLSRHSRVDGQTDGLTSVLVVDTDIAEKKQLETEFFQTQRLESLGVLARGIAHDLKNILMPISIVPQLLLKELPEASATTRKLLENLRRAAQQGTALAEQILAFASQPQGKPTLMQVGSLIQEVQQFVEHAFSQTITIQVSSADDLNPIRADATLLYQVLLNLCVNARDAMPGGGTLSISAHNARFHPGPDTPPGLHPGEYVVITIADTGTGIAPDILDRIFEPLFTTKPTGQGSGLGLSTVAKIVKDYQGAVRVASEVGSGCQFQVYLPAATASAPSPGAG